MNTLDELLKDTFDEEARSIQHDHLLASRVATRARRQIRRGRLRVGAAVAAFLVVAGVVGTQLNPFGSTQFSPGLDAPPAPAQDVVSAQKTSYADFLDDLARWAGFTDSPEVEPIRVLQDGLEHSELVSSCLADAGFAGSSHSFETDDEFAVFQAAFYTCHARYRLDDRFYEPRTESQIRFIRDFWIETSIPCLADLGYDIPQPPSAGVLIETWDSVDRYSAEGELSGRSRSEAEFIDALRRCPVMPPLTEILQR